MLKAIYIHGLGSGAKSSTGQALVTSHPDFQWIPVEVGETPYKDVAHLNRIIRVEQPDLIIGTSLGGFYNYYVDAQQAVKILVNPALVMDKILREKIGFGEYSFYCERLDARPSYVIDESVCEQYARFRSERRPIRGRANYAIFSAHDELIGDSDALDHMAEVYKEGYAIAVDGKGGHRLRRSGLALIKKIIKKEFPKE